LSAITIIFGMIESYKYLGFFKKHVGIDFKLLLNLMILSGFFVIIWSIINKRNLSGLSYKKLFSLNNFFLPVFFIFTYCIDNIASQRGSIYIFSVLHIQSDNLLYVLMASLMILFVRLTCAIKVDKAN
jgi:hypothetical protein